MKRQRTQKGFTIIELSIATLVFSVLLAIIMAAFLGVGRMFVKGVNMSLTQQDARNITDSISNDIRFSNAKPVIPAGQTGTNLYFCVGRHRYKFNLYAQVGQSGTYGLEREDVSGCPPLSQPGSSPPIEMLSNGMLLNTLQLGPAPGNQCSGRLCTITINLLYYGADDTVFTSSEHPQDTLSDHLAAIKDPDVHCEGSDVGTQFCATTSYTTTVLQSSLQDD